MLLPLLLPKMEERDKTREICYYYTCYNTGTNYQTQSEIKVDKYLSYFSVYARATILSEAEKQMNVCSEPREILYPRIEYVCCNTMTICMCFV
mmetsp:Transcript_5045/g.10959  ORF Transcript_5045/g.10959 Transcript_5045/m.10959 type:complete len:93 (-) Transcript_5045:219-497(-)